MRDCAMHSNTQHYNLTEHAADVVRLVLKPDAEASPPPWAAQTGAIAAALGAAGTDATRAALFEALLPHATALVDRAAHDALTAEELLIHQTPAGMCMQRTCTTCTNISLHYSYWLHACDKQPVCGHSAGVHACTSAHAHQTGTLSWEAAGGKSLLPDMLQGAMLHAVGKGAKAVNGAPPRDAKPKAKPAAAAKGPKGPAGKGNQQEAMRQEHLAREAEVCNARQLLTMALTMTMPQIRASVVAVKQRLERGLQLVAAMASGHAPFAHEVGTQARCSQAYEMCQSRSSHRALSTWQRFPPW